MFFVFGDEGVDVCFGVEVGNVGVVGVYLFGEGVLGGEFEFEFIGKVLLFEFFVFVDIV